MQAVSDTCGSESSSGQTLVKSCDSDPTGFFGDCLTKETRRELEHPSHSPLKDFPVGFLRRFLDFTPAVLDT